MQGFFWIAVYLVASVAPLGFALLGPSPPGRSIATDLSVALGFVGLAMLSLQFALTARFRRVAVPFGIDVVLRFHRLISLVAFTFILAHPVILMVERPTLIRLLNPLTAGWQARLGLLAIVALIVMISTSVWRTRLRLNYEFWRLLHGLLAVLVIGAGLGHVVMVGYYVGTPWKTALWSAITIGVVGLLVYTRLMVPIRLLSRPYQVEKVVPQRGRSWSLVLRPVGHQGLSFDAGQFAWLTLGNSPFGVEEHPFSFSSSADDHDRLELTVKELGDFSGAVGSTPTGSRAYLDGPHGAFQLEANEGPGFGFIAGGVGITPIMSILRTLADRGDRRPLLLVYGSASWDDVTFREDLEELTRRLDLTVVHVLNDPPDGWQGETGFVTRDLLDRHLPSGHERWRYFVCGPPPMMETTVAALRSHDVPAEHIVTEEFNLV